MPNPYQPGDLRHTFVALVDAIGVASKVQHELDQARHWSRVALPRCGNCTLWMTKSCPRERNVNGRKQGPSMNDAVCGAFTEKSCVAEWKAKSTEHAKNAERFSRATGGNDAT